MNRGRERPARWSARAILLGASLAALAGCERPIVGAPAQSGQGVGAPKIEITGATLGATGHLLVSLSVKSGGVPMSRDQLVALLPTFTLAALSPHPVDGLGAWRSLLPVGGQTAAQLPPSGPGTPPALVRTDVTQPGGETSGALSGDAGEFEYLFANAPADLVPTETLRVGVYLARAAGTPDTNATYDFVPAGGAAAPRDTVLDEDCDACHGTVRAHGERRVGVRICVTCHTWQLADPDTVDPAALDGATPQTDPNPLELGRMIHRIHRGKNLPTLYRASSTAANAGPPFASAPPLPFYPGRAGNPPVLGRKYSVVGYQGRELVFGRIAAVSTNFQAPRTVAQGVTYPTELRDCDSCHANAPQAYEVLLGVSRRTCSGCHPDVWFQGTPITDAVHLAHTGGPQPDDTQCRGCHVAATAAQPKVWVRISDAHVPLRRSPFYDEPTIEIVSVSGMTRDSAPTVVFRLKDRAGTIVPPNAPTPAAETSGPAPSPVPRAFPGGTSPGLRILLAGPTTPDYGTTLLQSSDLDASKALVNPDLAAAPGDPATGEIAYTFNAKLPSDAAGTWTVAFEGRRRATVSFFDVATQTFRWPYTGEQVSESPDNALAYVDTGTGTWTAAAPGAAVPRRQVVAEDRCLACHGRFELHGGQRHQVEHCLVCHAPSKTDWAQRPKVSATGNVNLAATVDGIEERSIHFKVMIHRIHTGGATGAATLEGIEPHVIYGYGGTPYFFDEAIFPSRLANCTLCHAGTTYRIASVPAGAPPTVANETPTVRHAGTGAHASGEPATPPIQAACLGCHGSSATRQHAAGHTESGVEQCASCHERGPTSVDVAHGLAQADAPLASASFASIAETVLVPRCASAACHGGSPPAAFPRLDAEAAYGAIVGVDSRQASGLKLVEPFAPDASYLLLKMRGDGASAGGIGTPMPTSGVLDDADLAAIEAWIAKGAPND